MGSVITSIPTHGTMNIRPVDKPWSSGLSRALKFLQGGKRREVQTYTVQVKRRDLTSTRGSDRGKGVGRAQKRDRNGRGKRR